MRDRPRRDGDAGAFQTLREMARVVDAAAKDPRFKKAAEKLRTPEGIWKALKRSHRFREDPEGFEEIDDPRWYVDQDGRVEPRWYGDCDDHAVIGATIGKAMGLRVAFALCNRRGPKYPYAHVLWGVVDDGGNFRPMDSQEADAPGEWPKWVSRKVVWTW